MNRTLLGYGTTYIHLPGISKERRGAKKYMKKYGRKYSKFDNGEGGKPLGPRSSTHPSTKKQTKKTRRSNIKLLKTTGKEKNLKISQRKKWLKSQNKSETMWTTR